MPYKGRKRWGMMGALLLLSVIWGCGEPEKETKTAKKENHPPVVRSVRILPEVPRAGAPLYVEVKAGDLDGDPLQYRYEWEVNGVPVERDVGSRLSSEYFAKGDRVRVWVTPMDGKTEGEAVASRPVEIRNTPPRVLEVKLTPQPAFPGDLLTAQVKSSDPDGEEVELRFEWSVNGEVVEESFEPMFSTDGLRRGDRISVVVIPEDSEGPGESLASEELTLQNRPPKILSQPPEGLAGPGLYRYQVRAVDPDGDPLEFHLEGDVPEGMRIHKSLGILEWRFEIPPKGPISVDIRVRDGHGGEAQQRYDFTLTPAVESRPG